MRIETTIIDNIPVHNIIYEVEDYRSESEKMEIKNICSNCDSFSDSICSECGCIVDALIPLKTNSCPINKW
jgi:hypothetical protein